MSDLHCPRCGYSLRGNTSGRCPECGEPATLEDVYSELARLRLTWARSYRVAVRVVALQSFGFILLAQFPSRHVPWSVTLAGFVLCLAAALVVAIRLGYDRGNYFKLEQSVHHGRSVGHLMHAYSIVFAVVFFVGLQAFILSFGLFMVAVR